MKLVEYMKDRGLSVKTVASEMNVFSQTIYSYNDGKHSPSARTVKRIADAMTACGAETTPIDLYKNVFTGV